MRARFFFCSSFFCEYRGRIVFGIKEIFILACWKKNTKGDDTHHLSFGIMHSGRYIGQEKRPLSVSFKGLIFRCYRRFDIKNAHPIQSGNDSHHIANRQY